MADLRYLSDDALRILATGAVSASPQYSPGAAPSFGELVLTPPAVARINAAAAVAQRRFLGAWPETTGGTPVSVEDMIQIPQSKRDLLMLGLAAALPPARVAQAARGALRVGTRLLEGAAPEIRELTGAFAPQVAVRGQTGRELRALQRVGLSAEQQEKLATVRPDLMNMLQTMRTVGLPGVRAGLNAGGYFPAIALGLLGGAAGLSQFVGGSSPSDETPRPPL